MPVEHENQQEHIFISFSNSDKDLVARLTSDLEKHGIPVWTDYEQLVPGTPDWESAIRDAIDRCFGVLLLASPNSRKSAYVKGEVDVAEMKGRIVYPIWSRGQDWPDCIPLSMTTTQYVDIRGQMYETGIQQIVKTLSELIDSKIPQHYSVSPLRRKVKVGKNQEIRHVRVPPQCFCIELSEEDNFGKVGGEGVIMKTDKYQCIRQLLDDLYIGYLKDRFEPFTYGKYWVLIDDNYNPCFTRVVAPWSWLLCADHRHYTLEHDWGLHTSLEQCGITSKSYLRVKTSPLKLPLGLAVNDGRLLTALQYHEKALLSLTECGLLRFRDPIQVVSDDFRFLYVLCGERHPIYSYSENRALVQTDEAVPEEELRYLMRYRP